MFDDDTKTLFLIECKSTKGTSIPLTMVRDNQIKGLQEASKHKLVAGFIVNFRNDNNDTFFIDIDNFINMIDTIGKKSFNVKDLINNNATRIQCEKKRTRYRYNIQSMIDDLYILR